MTEILSLDFKPTMASLFDEIRVDATNGGASLLFVLALRQDGYVVAGTSASAF